MGASSGHRLRSLHLLTCLSLCNTQARTVNLIHAILCDDEGVTQARSCLRHETVRGVERWHCTIYCLEFCASFNDAKRQHLSAINTNSDLSFTTIQKQTYCRKQLMDQSGNNSLTALLTKKDQVRFREVINTCTERRVEKRIHWTAWILSHVLRTTLCEHVNGLCPAQNPVLPPSTRLKINYSMTKECGRSKTRPGNYSRLDNNQSRGTSLKHNTQTKLRSDSANVIEGLVLFCNEQNN